MSGILGFLPIIIKTLGIIRVITIENLYQYNYYDDILIWANNEWVPLKSIERRKINKKIYRISNPYNWIFLTEDSRLMLENGEIKGVSEIKKDTKLFQVPYPLNDSLELPDPADFFDIQKTQSVPISDGESIKTKSGHSMKSIATIPDPPYNDNFLDFVIYIINRYNLTQMKEELVCFKCKYLNEARISDEFCYDMCEEEENLDPIFYFLDFYNNSNNIKNSKNALLLFRNNLEPNRILVWSFLEMQKIMILAKKVGYDPKIPISNAPNNIRFNLNYMTYKEDFNYFATNLSMEDYNHFLNDYFPEQNLIYPSFISKNKAYDTNLPQHDPNKVEGPPVFIEKDGSSYVKYIFDYDKDYIYNIKTTTGFFNAGVGRLIIKD
jgi:hypothetical protein